MNVEYHCLAHAVLLGMSMIEKGNLWHAFLVGFDRYLAMVINDNLFKIEQSCVVLDKENEDKKYDIKLLYNNYLKPNNFDLCVYKDNNELFYNSCRNEENKIITINDQKVFLYHNNNHFNINDLGKFLYDRKTRYCIKYIKSMNDKLNHLCQVSTFCIKF